MDRDPRAAQKQRSMNPSPTRQPSLMPSPNAEDKSLIVLDRDLTIRMVNATTLDLLGVREPDLVGKPVAAILGHPREAGYSLSSLSDLLLTENRRSIALTYYDRDQTPVPVTFSSFSLSDARGPTGVLCLASLREDGLGEALRGDAARTDHRLGVLSHELRTPLNGILGMAELLLTTKLDADQREYADAIMESGHTLFAAVRQLLDFGQAEAETTAAEPATFDLRECLDEAARHIRPLVKDKLLNLGIRIDPDVPLDLRGEPIRLRQVLMHLLDNAARFTEQGEILVRVRRDTPAGEPGTVRLRFSVEDTGIGVPLDKLAVIFEPFRQANEGLTRPHRGLGLGLSISRRLVELLGGTIWVERRDPEGSVFSFTAVFPVASHRFSDASLAAALDDGPAPGIAAPAVRRLEVLLAEGNRKERRDARRLLETWGHHVTCVEDGLDAVDAWKNGRFDLALLDLEMPKLDGLHTALSIRKLEGRAEHVPIIAMTAHAADREEQRSLLVGMDGCVHKPLVPGTLMQAIESVLHQGDTPAG